jgi:hypothetical protein
MITYPRPSSHSSLRRNKMYAISLAVTVATLIRVVSSRFLIGIELFPQSTENDKLQLVDLLSRLEAFKPISDIFVCYPYQTEMSSVKFLTPILTSQQIPFFFSPKLWLAPCSIQHPHLQSYSALIIANSIEENLLYFSTNKVLAFLSKVRESDVEDVDRVVGEMFPILLRSTMPDNELVALLDFENNSSSSFSDKHLVSEKFVPATNETKHIAEHNQGRCELWWPLDRSIWDIGISREMHVLLNCELLDEGDVRNLHVEISLDSLDGSVSISKSGNLQLNVTEVIGIPFASTDIVDRFCNDYLKVNIKLTFSNYTSSFQFDVKVKVMHPSAAPLASPVSYHPAFGSLLSRSGLGALMNSLGLLGTFVEIGVHRGEYALDVLKMWNGLRYFGVDPYFTTVVEDYVDTVNAGEVRILDMETALENLSQHADRVAILRTTGKEAATSFVDGTLDAVFIDAIHHYSAVAEDLNTWWPKVRSGGILSGHDYILGRNLHTVFTVLPVVNEFCIQMRVTCFRTSDVSWYILKP